MGEDDSGGKDLYAVLELARGATEEEIRQAFKALAIQNHPDKHPGDAKAALRFKRLNAAYQVLRDPEKREQYDQLTAPVEDFDKSALARPVPQVAVPPVQVYEPEIRRRRRRVRRTLRSGWSVFVAALGAASIVLVLVAVVLDRRNAAEGSDSSSAASHAATRLAQTPVEPPSPLTDIGGSMVASTAHLVGGAVHVGGVSPGAGSIVPVAPPDFNGRTVTGDHWQLTVPNDWQDATPHDTRDAKGVVTWQGTKAVAGVQPSVKLVTKPVIGEAHDYFQELDRRVPRGVAVESEIWEYESKPDGLKRIGRLMFDGTPPAHFIEFAVVSHGKAYEVTCTGPDDLPSAQAICEPILDSLQIK